MPDGKTDVLDTFVAEPFVAHSHEYYISIKQTRDGDVIYFSLEGGMEVEDNRDAIRSVTIPVLDSTLPVLDDLIA
jgi:succinyl-CoA synthetase beta subunit